MMRLLIEWLQKRTITMSRAIWWWMWPYQLSSHGKKINRSGIFKLFIKILGAFNFCIVTKLLLIKTNLASLKPPSNKNIFLRFQLKQTKISTQTQHKSENTFSAPTHFLSINILIFIKSQFKNSANTQHETSHEILKYLTVLICEDVWTWKLPLRIAFQQA